MSLTELVNKVNQTGTIDGVDLAVARACIDEAKLQAKQLFDVAVQRNERGEKDVEATLEMMSSSNRLTQGVNVVEPVLVVLEAAQR
ncbi:MAG: hypothetical protein R3E13_00580 [Alphaproteobacteria bacterium]